MVQTIRKMTVLFSIIMIVLCLNCEGFSENPANHYLYLNGVHLSPSDVIQVGDTVRIMFLYDGNWDPTQEKYKVNWTVTDYAEKLVTDTPTIDLTFDTIGIKDVRAMVVFDNGITKGNEANCIITVNE